MRVALVQLDLQWEDVEANHRRAERRIQEAAGCGARLVILPEMFCCGFSMDTGRVAQPEGGPTDTWLQGVAGDLGVHIIAGVPSLPGPRNLAVWTRPDGVQRRYAKVHPFTYANEQKHYAPGETLCSWTIEGVRITPFICYDLRFGEAFLTMADATDLYVVIANWPDRRRQHWRTLLQARAIENVAYVAGVNRVGDGGGLHYSGDSMLVSPWGEPLVCGSESEVLLIADVDPGHVQTLRTQFPVLTDRRPDRYHRPATTE